jgi:hypothetical protein
MEDRITSLPLGGACKTQKKSSLPEVFVENLLDQEMMSPQVVGKAGGQMKRKMETALSPLFSHRNLRSACFC